MSKVVVHRPARIAPPAVAAGVREIKQPPNLADPTPVNVLQSVLPALAGVGSLLFVISRPSPLAIVAGGMFALASILMGVGLYVSARTSSRRRTRLDRARYLDYLARVGRDACATAGAQRTAAWWRHPSPDGLWAFAASPQRLWERRSSDSDALQARIGVGSVTLATPLALNEADNPLVQPDPVTVAAAKALVGRRSRVGGMPVTIDLRATRVASLLGERPALLGTAAALLAQLVTFHSPRDLRVAVLCDGARLADWDWVKWLPHNQHPTLLDAAGPARMVATTAGDLAELLDGQLVPAATGHLVVVLDQLGSRSASPATRSGDLAGLLWTGLEAGVTVLHLGAERADEPGVVDRRVLLGPGGRLDVEAADGAMEAVEAAADQFTLAQARALARGLAPLALSARSAADTGGETALGSANELPDLLGLADLETYDPAAAWASPRTERDFLRVPVGVDGAGAPVYLDLKESALGGMGPHGLMIGATGSGKSELLRTLVTGLALTHPPELLSFTLVDFKGGAAFAGLAELPHVAGVITNLADDQALIERMHAALFGEMQRRQELLKQAGNLASVRAYQAAWAEGRVAAPLPVLVVVIDEFGELLASRPEFTELFVAIGRLGRSLGIHLLFASQRLEEGRLRGLESHLSYRLALRTFSAAESRVVIGTDDAYRLPPLPGSAFLKVDTTVYQRFRAALVSGPYEPAGEAAARAAEVQVEAPAVTRFGALGAARRPGEAGEATGGRRAPALRPPVVDQRTMLDVAVERLRPAGQRVHQVWLPPLPPTVTLDELLPRPRVVRGRGISAGPEAAWSRLRVPVGVVDKPAEQRQDPLWLDLSGPAGNLAVTGAPQSGKSVFLRTVVTSLALTHTPEQVQVYAIDYGGGGLAALAGLPHVGGVATRLDAERVRRILHEVAGVLTEREALFAEHGIDSVARFRALRAAGRLPELGDEPLGDVFLVVDNWVALRGAIEEADAMVVDIAARGLGYGVHVVLATARPSDIRTNLKDSFGSKVEFRLGDSHDSDIDRKLAALVPEGLPGRGLGQDKLQFQAALPRLDGRPDLDTLAAAGQRLATGIAQHWTGRPARPVRVLPSRVTASHFVPGRGRGVIIGVAERDLAPVSVDLRTGDPHFLVYGDAESGKTAFLRAYLRGLQGATTLPESRVFLVDLRRTLMGVLPDDWVCSYSGSLATARIECQKLYNALAKRLPPAEVTVEQLRTRSWWTGPDIYVVVDDYDLVGQPGSNPLGALLELIPQARDIGLHVILARRVAGASRAAFEPVVQRVRETSEQGLLLAGDPAEGRVLGGLKAAPGPPGRGTLVRRRLAPERVQVLWAPDSVEAVR